jgi:hypothetical protein
LVPNKDYFSESKTFIYIPNKIAIKRAFQEAFENDEGVDFFEPKSQKTFKYCFGINLTPVSSDFSSGELSNGEKSLVEGQAQTNDNIDFDSINLTPVSSDFSGGELSDGEKSLVEGQVQTNGNIDFDSINLTPVSSDFSGGELSDGEQNLPEGQVETNDNIDFDSMDIFDFINLDECY